MKLKEESEKFGLKSNIQKTKIMASSPVTSQKRDGETGFIVGGSKITTDGECSDEIKITCSLEGKLWPTYTAYYKAEALLYQQNLSSQSYGFSSSHIWMWELDYKESWVLKNWCFWTVVLEKTLESPLD